MWRIEFFAAMSRIGPVVLLTYVVEQGLHRGAVVAGVVGPTERVGQLVVAFLLMGVAYLPPASSDPGAGRADRLENPGSWVAALCTITALVFVVMSAV